MRKQKSTLVLLGPAGSFSDIAAERLKMQFNKKYVGSIPAIFRNVRKGDYGFAPIENKLVGAVSASEPVYGKKWLIKKRFKMRVNFVLAAKKKIPLSKIKFLYCADIANYQCKKFIKTHLSFAKKTCDFASTSSAFKKVVQQKSFSAAVIGSSLAAKLYNLKILARNIQDDPYDWTVFALFTRI